MPANNPKPGKPSDAKPAKAVASADSVDPAVDATAVGATPVDATPVDATGADAPEDEEAVPMNRAERRAKGKAAAKPPIIGKIQPGRTNQNHGPRSYANRRSG